MYMPVIANRVGRSIRNEFDKDLENYFVCMNSGTICVEPQGPAWCLTVEPGWCCVESCWEMCTVVMSGSRFSNLYLPQMDVSAVAHWPTWMLRIPC